MRVIDHLYAREHAFVNISTQFHFIYFIRKCGDGNYPDNHTPIDVGEPRRSMSHLLSSSRETMASTSRRELQLQPWPPCPHSRIVPIPPCAPSHQNYVFRTRAYPASCKTLAVHRASPISSRKTFLPLA